MLILAKKNLREKSLSKSICRMFFQISNFKFYNLYVFRRPAVFFSLHRTSLYNFVFKYSTFAVFKIFQQIYFSKNLFFPSLFFSPTLVAPFVLYLCHSECADNGQIFEIGGGLCTKIRLERSEGITCEHDFQNIKKVNFFVFLQLAHRKRI
jgi:hypothetical protein